MTGSTICKYWEINERVRQFTSMFAFLAMNTIEIKPGKNVSAYK